MSTVWHNLRKGKFLIKIVRKYNDNNKVFYDEQGNIYYTHRRMNCKLPFWIEKNDCKRTIYGSPNIYFKPKCYLFPKETTDFWSTECEEYFAPKNASEKTIGNIVPLTLGELIEWSHLLN